MQSVRREKKFSKSIMSQEKILWFFYFKSFIFIRNFSRKKPNFICFLIIIVNIITIFSIFNVSVKILKIKFFPSLLTAKYRIITYVNKYFVLLMLMLIIKLDIIKYRKCFFYPSQKFQLPSIHKCACTFFGSPTLDGLNIQAF